MESKKVNYNHFMKTYPILIFLFLSFFVTLSSFGQRPTDQARPERKFTGQVIDGAIKKPMIGANVLIKTVTDSLLRGTVTGADGRFEIARPFIPEVKVEITFLGYKKSLKILVGNGL